MNRKIKRLLLLSISIIIGISLSFLIRKKDNYFAYKIDPKYYSDKQSIYENDFDYVFDTLEKYYALFYRNGTYDFLKNRDAYKKELKNIKTDREFFDKMNKILSRLEDGHTNLLDSEETYHIKETFSLANDNYLNSVNIDLINYLFETKISKIKIFDKIFGKSLANTQNLKVQDINKDISYLKIRSMIDPESDAFADDLSLLKSYLKKSKNKRVLIIDIRGNGGGNASYIYDYLYPMIMGKKDFKDTHEYILFRTDEVFKYDPQYPEIKRVIKKIKESDFKYMEENIPFLKKDKEMMGDLRKNYTHIIFNPGYKNKGEFKDDYKFDGNIYLLVDRDVYSSPKLQLTFLKIII